MRKKKKKSIVFHGLFCNSQRSAKTNKVTNLKQRKIRFTHESFTLRMNLFVLLNGLKSIMKTNLWKKRYI